MTAALSQAELSAIALFPLPRVALFPATTLPLHVFEPRYRTLMDDCIEQERMCLCVVQLRPGYEADYHGRPAIHRVGGAGRITAHRKNADGTFDIEVACANRVTLEELKPDDKPYRRAFARVLPDAIAGMLPAKEEIAALWSLASQVTELIRKQRGVPVQLLGSASAAAPQLVDAVADQLIADPHVRQNLLEMQDVHGRLALTKNYLAKLHLSLLSGSGKEPTTLH